MASELLVARHLVVAHGVQRLVLASRRGDEAPGVAGLVDELVGLGAAVSVVACDVSQRGDVEALIGGLAAGDALSAVVHAAGVVDDGMVESLSVEQMGRVWRPKVDGALFLDELTAGLGLSAFVVFSSAAGVIGSPGQGNYAAANAVLDALAVRRRAAGLAGSSVAWGLWDGSGGMGAEVGAAGLARLARLGMVALAPDVGLELFDAAVAGAEPVVVAAGLDVPALSALAREGRLPAVLGGLVRVPVRRRGAGEAPLARRLAATADEDRQGVVLEVVRTAVAAVLSHDSVDSIDPDRAFKDLGFDSLAAVELRNGLTHTTGLRLPATLVFDHPTPAAVADHVLAKLAPATAPQAPSCPTTKSAERWPRSRSTAYARPGCSRP